MNKPYPKGKEHFAQADIDWTSGTFKLIAMTAAYTYSATHEFVTNLSHIVGRSNALTSLTDTGGVLNSASALFPTMTGAQFFYLAIVHDTGSDATSELLYYIDTGTGLPTTPDGIDVTVTPHPTGGWFPL